MQSFVDLFVVSSKLNETLMSTLVSKQTRDEACQQYVAIQSLKMETLNILVCKLLPIAYIMQTTKAPASVQKLAEFPISEVVQNLKHIALIPEAVVFNAFIKQAVAVFDEVEKLVVAHHLDELITLLETMQATMCPN
jgi:hypothetical protein